MVLGAAILKDASCSPTLKIIGLGEIIMLGLITFPVKVN